MSVEEKIKEIQNELDTIRNTKTPQDAKTEKMLINIFGQLDLQFNLLTEIIKNVTQFNELMSYVYMLPSINRWR